MVKHLFMSNKPLLHIFLWPGLIALLAMSGLILALVFDGMPECLANLAIGLPVLVAAFFYWIVPLYASR